MYINILLYNNIINSFVCHNKYIFASRIHNWTLAIQRLIKLQEIEFKSEQRFQYFVIEYNV